ncbi:MAG: O-antigen ligase family protein [Gracilibacteraceae bacterium]|nr:O-antigen ligase family protein [Gracilibacteraceae bacterium]
MSKKSVKNKARQPAPAPAPSPASTPAFIAPLLTFGAGTLFFFFVTFIGSFDAMVEKVIAFIGCLALALLCLFVRSARFRRFLAPSSLPLIIYVVLGGVSTLYAVAGKFAVSEFAKLFAAFVLYVLTLCLFNPGTLSVRRICSVLAAAAAVFSLISIDAASAGFCTDIFRRITDNFTQAYMNAGSVLTGARISSIFNTPNIFGGVAGLGLLLSIYLTATAAKTGEKCLQTVFLGVTALAFLFTFSMGATLCVGLSALVMLILSAPAERVRFFVLMLETLFAALIVMYFTFGYLGTSGPEAWIPMVGAGATCLVLLVLERFVGEPLSAFLSKNSRAALIAAGAIAAALLVVALLASSLAGPARLAAGENLRRAAYPDPGEHVLTVAASAPLDVIIDTQNMEEVMMHKQTTLYAGPAGDGVSFTVPEGSRVVWFEFRAPTETELTAAAYDGHALKLRYTLLPASIANRMQGLLANQNAIQRFVFFYDGLKIFARSPLIGLGLGGYENAIFSVQDFYYTTKYAHNHYVQILAELGLLGFIPYLIFLIFTGRALWRAFRAGKQPAFTAALAACFVMIITHSALEVVMSAGAFLSYAFVLFALITLECDLPATAAAPQPAARKDKTARRRSASPASPYPLAVRCGLCAFALIFFLLLLGNLAGRQILANALTEAESSSQHDASKFFADMAKAATVDVFETNDYLLSYVITAPQAADPQIRDQANKYAERLAKAKSNTIQGRLTEYYFMVGNPAAAFEMSRQILNYRRADPAIWPVQFDLIAGYYQSVVGSGAMSQEDYIAATRGIYELLLTANETRMESIALTEENLRFLRELGIIEP